MEHTCVAELCWADEASAPPWVVVVPAGAGRSRLHFLPFHLFVGLKHGVGVGRHRRDGLENIPVLYDFPVFVETKNIQSCLV